jgi:hypothetical protein
MCVCLDNIISKEGKMITQNYVVVKMKKVIYACFSLLFLTAGCVSAMKPVTSMQEQIASFKIGEQQEALLGDPMVYKIDALVGVGYIAVTDFQPPSEFAGMLSVPMIKKGSEWTVIGILEDGTSICQNDSFPHPVAGDGTRVIWEYCLAVDKNNIPYGYTACLSDKASVHAWPQPNNFLKRVEKTYRRGAFKQELIYNGKSGNTIRLSYREYKDDFARPAFFQDLSYDLSEGKTIGFKGMKIEVNEATNSLIKFIVKSPMK